MSIQHSSLLCYKDGDNPNWKCVVNIRTRSSVHTLLTDTICFVEKKKTFIPLLSLAVYSSIVHQIPCNLKKVGMDGWWVLCSTLAISSVLAVGEDLEYSETCIEYKLNDDVETKLFSILTPTFDI